NRSSTSTPPAGLVSAAVSVTAAGNALPDETGVITGETISVAGGLLGSDDGLNSCTRPLTWMLSPIATAGAEDVKTKMPSLVLESPSGADCRKNPLAFFPVTMPLVATLQPSYGEREPGP